MSEKMLTGRVCLITGAGHGIGRAIAEKFAEEGAIVYANSLHENSIEEWKKQSKYKGRIETVCFDVSDSKALRNAILQIKREKSKIDVIVNNAGIVSYEPLSMVSREHLEELFNVNVFAVFESIQIISRIMKRQGYGNIINIASVVGMRGAAGQAAYSMTKGAVISLTKSAAKELVESNIRVNAIAPGMVATERFVGEMEKRFPFMKEKIGMGRLADPKEIANAAFFLASDMSSYMTGQIIEVEGGSNF